MGIVTVFDRDTGRILRTVHASSDVYLPDDTEAVLPGEHAANCQLIIGMDDDGNELLSIVTVEPAEPTIETMRAACWERIKAERDVRSRPASVTAGGLVWDTNARSRELIRDALMTAAIVGPTWSSMWTLADNTRFLATAADLQGVVLAYASVTEYAFQAAAAMREQVDAAGSIYALNAITWPAP